MDRRRYFSSSQQEYNFSRVECQSYLYVYKHNYPQIIVRFPSPQKTITGYRLYHAQIIYHPFYQLSHNNSHQLQPNASINNQYQSQQLLNSNTKIQTITLQYQGQIILSLQNTIFHKYFQQEVLNHLLSLSTSKSSINNKKYNKKSSNQQHSFHLSPHYLYTQNHNQPKSTHKIQSQQISQIFKLLLKQWVKDPQISAMFCCSQKHLQSFEAYDHGYIKLQVVKTSDKTLTPPFHAYMKQRQWSQKQIADYYKENQNKTFYFQFQSSIFIPPNQDFHYVQKLGFVVSHPLTTNQFLYQVLMHVFAEFQADVKQKEQQKKRQQEKIKMRQTILQNLRKIGVSKHLQDLQYYQQKIYKPKPNQSIEDPLDKKLNQLLSKKQNKSPPKNISYIKGEPSYTQNFTTFHHHNQSSPQNSPRRRLSTKLSDMREQELKNQHEKTKRYRSPTLNTVKVIRSFTSELLDDDFEQIPKRRFITRQQYLKILEFNSHVMAKKQDKLRRASQGQNKIYEQPHKQNEQMVYVGIENTRKQYSMKKSSKTNRNDGFKFEYFAVNKQTIIHEDEPLRKPRKYSWQEDDEDFQSYEYNDNQQDYMKMNEGNKFEQEQQMEYERKDCFELDSSFMDKINN